MWLNFKKKIILKIIFTINSGGLDKLEIESRNQTVTRLIVYHLA